MSNTQNHRPVEIQLHQKTKQLELLYARDEHYFLSCEYLRVHSPSAEVRGHMPGQEVLQIGKENVTIVGIEPVGNYAIKLIFDDGHDTGIYDWDYLYNLAINQDKYWEIYQQRLHESKTPNDPNQ